MTRRTGARTLQARWTFALRCGTWAVVISLLCPGCGDGTPTKDVVLQREFSWVAAMGQPGSAAGPALQVERHWSGRELRELWSTRRALLGDPESPELLLSGTSYLSLDAPLGSLDTALHHELVVRARGTGVSRLVFRWHEQGGDFDEEHSVDLPAPPEGDPTDLVLDLPGAMKGRLEGPVGGWRLSALGEFGRPVSLQVASVSLRSPYETAVNEGFSPMAVARDGVRMNGLCLSLPGALSTRVSGDLGERLVMSVAVVAGSSPVTLSLADDAGLLTPLSLELPSGESWRDVQLDLSPLAGKGSVGLTLRATGAPSLLLVGGVRRMGASTEPRPNTVLWIVDTLRSDRLSTYGYGPQTDPILAQLAEEGVRVEHVYAASNWTRPAVSSLLTGVGPEIHGNDSPGRQIDKDLVTLAGELSRAGYLTVSFNTNYHAGLWSGLDKGFDVQFQPRHFPRLDPPTSLTSSQIAGPLAEFVEQHAGEALFLYVHCLDPHAPYVPQQQDLQALAAQKVAGAPVPADQAADVKLSFRERSPAYDAEIRHADRELGRFDAQLRRLGLAQDTLLVFTSDHGESFAEHGTWGHWRSLYDSEVRVPWVMRWPDGLPAGRVVDTWAGHIDLAPTLLGLLSLPRPQGWTGRDLSAVMQDRTSRAPDVVHVIDSISGAKESLGHRSLAAVGQGWKLIVDVGESGELLPQGLYDLAADPGELRDRLSERGAPELLLEALADHLRRAAALGHGQGAADVALDPELQRWLEEMGYLR